MAGTISFLGLSGDTDYSSMIDALVEVRSEAYLAPLEDKIYDYEDKQVAVSEIDSLLSTFYSAVRSMDRTNEFLTRSASTSDESVFTATASSDAVLGSHSITVNQLAQAETEVHGGLANGLQYHTTGVSDKTDAINSSGEDRTYIYSYNGTTYTNTVADGGTLEDLQAAINDDASGVTASIVNDGEMDHMVLSEDTPNSSLSIEIDPDGEMTLDGEDATTDFTADAHSRVVNASGSTMILELQYGENDAVEISVDTGTTLEELATLINTYNLGIQASVLDDGSNGSGSAHLVLAGEDAGSDYAITINPSSATTLDGTGLTVDFTAGNFAETATAVNSQIQVDGYPAGPPWIERSSNKISDVIEGVTIDLKDAGTDISLAVSTDTSAIMEKIEEFTEAFNAVRSAIIDYTSYDNDTGESGVLLGNYAIKTIKTRLDNIVTGTIPGYQYPEDAYVSLQQLGFSTDTEDGSETEGLLVIDTDVLNEALNDDPDAVAALFSNYMTGKTDSNQIRFASALSTATPGVYEVEIDTDTEQGRFKLNGEDWSEWYTLSGTSGNYTLTGTEEPEKGIALDISLSSGTGTHTAQLQYQNGVAVSLNDELTKLLSEETGPTNVLDASYEESIDGLIDQYEVQSERLANYEDMLVKRFTNLDGFVSQMNSLSSTISSMASSLPTSS